MNPPVLSIIIPVYNNPRTLEHLLERIEAAIDLSETSWHVLFVDDGSSDNTREELKSLARRYPRSGWIGLEKNTGQQKALFYGLLAIRKAFPERTPGWVVTMDDDLAHPPEVIPRLLKKAREGWDLVYGVPGNGDGGKLRKNPGGRARDLFFRFCLKKPASLRLGSFRIFNRQLVWDLTEEMPRFVYLSAMMFLSARKKPLRMTHVDYLFPEKGLETAPAEEETKPTVPASRYRPGARLGLFLGLIFYYSPALAWLHGNKTAVPETIKESGGFAAGFRIQILGGSAGQVSALLKAKEMGLQTVVSDLNPKAPGAALADFTSQASTFDPVQTARDALILGSGALLATGTDQPVLTAARVSSRLKLPFFLTPRQAGLVTNKREMKNAFLKNGIPTSPFRILSRDFTSSKLEGLSFPLVIKPLDSQGQRGVYRVEAEDEIRRVFSRVLSFSRENELIVEEYYPSREITVSGWMEDGIFLPLITTDRVTLDNPPHIGVCLAHHYPSRFRKKEPEIRELTQRIISAFGLISGPVYFQYLVGEEGIRVNETACRLGGAYEDEFIPWITGVDILDIMIKKTCGFSYDRQVFCRVEKESRNKVVSLQMFFFNPGRLAAQGGMEEALKIPGVMNGKFLLTPGTIIREKSDSTQRAGYFIVTGNSPGEVNKKTGQAWECLWARDEGGQSLIQRHDIMMMPQEEEL